ncbi:uncharacterized protein LOC108411609 [Pygocentrus nattereri]|uniref:uncharacterized protein LOC108411609 n=1 Tax=Pygocentrus nattereri TaxID=42514 RepID=UPI0018912380|nr:uncharacterized protein LOC108411609 [Pygocentrus nattereri]
MHAVEETDLSGTFFVGMVGHDDSTLGHTQQTSIESMLLTGFTTAVPDHGEEYLSHPHCLGASTVMGHPGENATIGCSYPEGLEEHAQLLIRPDIRDAQSLKDRVAVSEDRSSRVLNVNISDVREDDGGLYYCVAVAGGTLLSYVFFSKEIQLQVIGSSIIIITIIIIIIITVCICAALLLIGGSTLIFYKLRCKKTQNFADVSRQPDTHYVDEVSR